MSTGSIPYVINNDPVDYGISGDENYMVSNVEEVIPEEHVPKSYREACESADREKWLEASDKKKRKKIL